MKQVDGKGSKKTRTGLQLLAAQVEHYAFLRNHSLRRAELGAEASKVPVGTTSNEAAHGQLKKWGSCVHRQSLELLCVKILIMLYYKMATEIWKLFHSSATDEHVLAGHVSAKFSAMPGDLVIHTDSVEQDLERQRERREVNERERVYQATEKKRKGKIAKSRGIRPLILSAQQLEERRGRKKGSRLRSFRRGPKRPFFLVKKSRAALRGSTWRDRRERLAWLRCRNSTLGTKRDRVLLQPPAAGPGNMATATKVEGESASVERPRTTAGAATKEKKAAAAPTEKDKDTEKERGKRRREAAKEMEEQAKRQKAQYNKAHRQNKEKRNE